VWALPLLLLIVVVVWVLAAPGTQFLSKFSRLLDQPRIESGHFSVLSGQSSLRGQFGGREVAVELQLKRSRHGQGDLVVAIRSNNALSLNTSGIESRVRHADGQRALTTLAAHDLLLSVDQGWLRAWWRPQGFVYFPGRFDERKWREVLEALGRLSVELET
jgi:hypothetical protein